MASASSRACSSAVRKPEVMVMTVPARAASDVAARRAAASPGWRAVASVVVVGGRATEVDESMVSPEGPFSDRTSVLWGTSVYVRVEHGGRRTNKNKKRKSTKKQLEE